MWPTDGNSCYFILVYLDCIKCNEVYIKFYITQKHANNRIWNTVPYPFERISSLLREKGSFWFPFILMNIFASKRLTWVNFGFLTCMHIHMWLTNPSSKICAHFFFWHYIVINYTRCIQRKYFQWISIKIKYFEKAHFFLTISASLYGFRIFRNESKIIT